MWFCIRNIYSNNNNNNNNNNNFFANYQNSQVTVILISFLQMSGLMDKLQINSEFKLSVTRTTEQLCSQGKDDETGEDLVQRDDDKVSILFYTVLRRAY